MDARVFEKLGVFYLGRGVNPETGAARGEPLLYDSKDLTTHGLIVGMTGSGKTGLGAVLLEEAALDGVPALVVDPKGDMGNLALRFPELAPGDFLPWIDPAEAAREGLTREQAAAATSARWREGVETFGQTPARIASLVEAAEVTLYTPGASAGRPLALLRSFDAPPAEMREDDDALRERVASAASGLLELAGVEADPVVSHEHILVSSLLDRAWRAGESPSLEALLKGVQEPPFDRLGALELESVYPAKERFELATRLNNLLASPSFAAWRQGDPLDIQKLLYSDRGRPRVSVLSIAHLSDRERMFFVTFLLNEVVAWMRRLDGTGSLRAILYMDEIFGFFPPVKAPPSKAPMLTLLKQARAYGLGVVLATQNPVDLDYKGLANIGTWFLGRLQTARDRERLLDGLQSAASNGGMGRGEASRRLASLSKRVFLVQNVHEDGPSLFETRWALSYLRGPMTLEQIRSLQGAAESEAPDTPAPPPAPLSEVAGERPRPPAGIDERFLPSRSRGGGAEVYRPGVVGTASLHYVQSKHELDWWSTLYWWAPLDGPDGPAWAKGESLTGVGDRDASPGVAFAVLPESATRPSSYDKWRKALAGFLYREQRLLLLSCADPRASSRPGERESEFRTRVAHLARERRDEQLEKIRQELAPKLAKLEEDVRRAEEKLAKESSEYGASRLDTAVDFGMTLAGALFGRKLASVANASRARRAARSASRAGRERQDLARAEESLSRAKEKLSELERELASRTEALRALPTPESLELKERELRPRKSDIQIESFSLAWRRD